MGPWRNDHDHMLIMFCGYVNLLCEVFTVGVGFDALYLITGHLQQSGFLERRIKEVRGEGYKLSCSNTVILGTWTRLCAV